MSAAEHPFHDPGDALPMIQGLSRLHDWVALLDRDGRVVWLSDGLASTCGGGRSFKGRHWLEAVAEAEDRPRLQQSLDHQGRVSNEPVRLRANGHGDLPVRVSAARLDADCGHVVAIFRQGEASEETRHALRYLSAVLDNSPNGVVVIDRSRFITYANPAMEEICGWSVRELVDRPLAVFLNGEEDLSRIGNALGEQPRVRDIELSVRAKDGGSLDVNVSVSRLALEDGTSVGAVAYVEDISERRHFERDLARKNEELEHYVHTVSHDLRSPLVSVLGFSRLLREEFAEALGEKGAHFVRRIEEAGRTMEDLIHDLLELSRIDAAAAPERVDPREVLLQLQAELKPRLDESSVTLELPADPGPVCCERTRLYQIFSNLIGNALDHMGGVPSARISVEVDSGREKATLRVADNGVGIDPEHHDRIFEIFQSMGGTPAAGKSGRTGMGLAIVKKIAQSRGGRAWVESHPGEGAAFYVEIPHA